MSVLSIQQRYSGYSIGQKLGDGSYGVVYKITKEDKVEAFKALVSQKDEGVPYPMEIDTMFRLRHKRLMYANFISYIERYFGFSCPYSPQNLKEALMCEDVKSFEDKKAILADITDALGFLHRQNLLHLDIKPHNILLYKEDGHWRGCLADFSFVMFTEDGNGRNFPQAFTSKPYRAPEIIGGSRKYTKSCDIWSLGLVFLMTLTGKTDIAPHTSRQTKNLMAVIRKELNHTAIGKMLSKADIPKSVRQSTEALVKKMLTIDASARPTCAEILASPIFKGYEQDRGSIIMPASPSIESDMWEYLEASMADMFVFYTKYYTIHRVRSFFIVLDLMYRCVNFQPSNEKHSILVPYCLAWIVMKTLESIIPTTHSIFTAIKCHRTDVNIIGEHKEEEVESVEKELYIYLEGIIMRPTIYDWVSNLETLAHVLTLDPKTRLTLTEEQAKEIAVEGKTPKQTLFRDLMRIVEL